MYLINGRQIADKILSDLKKEIKTAKIRPGLATILVGNDAASRLYVSLKEKTAKKIGVNFKKYIFPAKVSQKEILSLINKLNQDKTVQGILVQMPLPKHLSADRIIAEINPEKDIDGFLAKSKFEPPFILAIWEALKSTDVDLKNKKIVALVNSEVFGQKLKEFFKKRRIDIFVIARGEAAQQSREIRRADVLITACGRPNFIKGDMIKKSVILLDGGIAKKDGKIAGDIDAESVKEKASWLSPVPGGIGPITIAMLLKNLMNKF